MDDLVFTMIDKNRAVPLYYQISEQLERLIREGRISAGEQILPEEVLAEKFGVSRPTINKAINLLISKSMLQRERGRGTYVKNNEVKLTLMQELVSLHEALKAEGISFRTAVLEVKVQPAGKEIGEKLGIPAREKVLYLCRLRYIEDEAVLFSCSYLPYALFPALENADFSHGSLYEILDREYHQPVVKTERCASAVKALEKETGYFNIPFGDPLIRLEGVAYGRGDLRVEYFVTKIRGDRAVLCTTLYR